MGLRTVEEYRAGLLDSRRVFYRGRQVKDVAADPGSGAGRCRARCFVPRASVQPDRCRGRPRD